MGIVVVEWDWEAFDEATARWCLERKVQPDGWLRRRLDAWADSAAVENLFSRDGQ